MTDKDRKDFMTGALPVVCAFGEERVQLMPKQFSSGSVGWHGNCKSTVHGVRVQCNVLLTIVGSKPEVQSEQKNSNTAQVQEGTAKASQAKKGKSST